MEGRAPHLRAVGFCKVLEVRQGGGGIYASLETRSDPLPAADRPPVHLLTPWFCSRINLNKRLPPRPQPLMLKCPCTILSFVCDSWRACFQPACTGPCLNSVRMAAAGLRLHGVRMATAGHRLHGVRMATAGPCVHGVRMAAAVTHLHGVRMAAAVTRLHGVRTAAVGAAPDGHMVFLELTFHNPMRCSKAPTRCLSTPHAVCSHAAVAARMCMELPSRLCRPVARPASRTRAVVHHRGRGAHSRGVLASDAHLRGKGRR
eukprot:356939-Chlamydomonas_euryale.AAC.2